MEIGSSSRGATANLTEGEIWKRKSWWLKFSIKITGLTMESPPHWCCKYFKDGFAEYEYFENCDAAYEYAFKHGYAPF